jgi:putative ABC transport system ATP-binding protein
MLKIENVSKIYKKGPQQIKAINDLTLTIETGEFVAISGPSGSGKSSLLLTLGGMLSPTHGKVWIDEQSFYDATDKQRTNIRKEKIGFLFQSFNLIPYLSAIQNVQLPLLVNGANEKKQTDRAVSLLERMGLGDRLNHKPSELSIGQQQRLALARTIANDPKIILADEPTGSLDNAMSQQVIRFLQEMNKEGKTVVLVTHDCNISNIANRSIAISGGKLSQEAP